MFGALFFERDPLLLRDLPARVLSWFQDAGGFAMAGLVLWLLIGLPRWRSDERASVPDWQKRLFLGAAIVAAVGYVVYFALFPFVMQQATESGPLQPGQQPTGRL